MKESQRCVAHFKHSTVSESGVLEGEEKEKGAEKYLKQWPRTSPICYRTITFRSKKLNKSHEGNHT